MVYNNGLLNERVRLVQFNDFHSLFEYANDAIFLFNLTADGAPARFVEVNQVACARLGYTREELLTVGPLDLTPEERLVHLPEITECLYRDGRVTFEGSYTANGGEVVPFEFSVRRFILSGRPYVLSIGRDLTERKRTEFALRETESHYRHLVEASPEMVAVVCEEQFVFVNDAGAQLLGASHPHEVTGAPVWRFLHPDYYAISRERMVFPGKEGVRLPPIEKRMIRFDGTPVDVEVQSTSIVYQGRPALLVLARDITDRKKSAETIHRMAYYDDLTGLPNQRMFNECLTNAISQAKWSRRLMALLYVDLDRFKVVSDSFGRQVGDQLLRATAERLSQTVGGRGLTAHIGGDEFAVILEGISSPGEAAEFAGRIVQAVGNTPYTLGEQEVFVNCSVGIGVYPEDGLDSSALFRSADLAMNRVKAYGGNGLQVYNATMNNMNLLSRRIQMEHHLHQSLEKGELSLVYQPKVTAKNGRMIGVEALLRWKSDSFGWVSPSEFVPLAEENGLIMPIGEFVLRQACKQAKQWEGSGVARLPVAVNISPRQFLKADLVRLLRSLLDEAKLCGEWIELEITERLLMDDSEQVIHTIQALREMGVKIAIDDFGTGYSSLQYLKRFPVDRLKIDQSFVTDISVDSSHAEIVAAMIDLGHSLHMTVLAEGVETLFQREFLVSRNCDEMQGYLFSKPMPATVLTAQLLTYGKEPLTKDLLSLELE